MKVERILERKGREVVTVGPGDTVAQALGLLVRHGIGSLVVVDGSQIQGIVTERDVLTLVDRGRGLDAASVQEIMTRDLIVAVSDDDVAYLMEIMTRNRVRHLPVVEENRLVGLISIGDVVNAVRQDAEAENRYLRRYVQGGFR